MVCNKWISINCRRVTKTERVLLLEDFLNGADSNIKDGRNISQMISTEEEIERHFIKLAITNKKPCMRLFIVKQGGVASNFALVKKGFLFKIKVYARYKIYKRK